MGSPELRLDWASTQAAAYACRHWHYSGCLPVGKLVKIGVWESGRFVGVVIFGRGTALRLGWAYGLDQTTCCELVRVALREHRTPVSRIVAIALRLLRKRCPGLRLVVSFASQDAGHHGGIYQAGGWIYSGTTRPNDEFLFRGKRAADRSVVEFSRKTRLSRKRLEAMGVILRLPTKKKHRYLMPLDAAIRERVEALAKPYPKRNEGRKGADE
jgi:hypothetical protein